MTDLLPSEASGSSTNEDDRVVKVAGLRSAGEIRVGSIPTPRKRSSSKSARCWTTNGPVAQLVERGAYTLVYT